MSIKNKILIVGGDSVIGSFLYNYILNNTDYILYKTSRKKSNLNDFTLYLDLISSDIEKWEIPKNTKAIIICAAVARIADCYNNPIQSSLININSCIKIAKNALKQNIHIIFLSTNQVFDGSKPYYKTTDEVCPLTEYGRQKSECEKQLLKLNYKKLSIIRLTKVVYPELPLFQDWKNKLFDNNNIFAFHDMFLSPVLLNDVSSSITKCLINEVYGIYHLSGLLDVSYFNLAKKISLFLSKPLFLVKKESVFKKENIIIEKYIKYTSLNCDLSKKNLSFYPKNLNEVIINCFKK